LLAAFSPVYGENMEQKEEQKDLKTCNLVRKTRTKLRLRKAWFLKKLAPLKESQVFGVGMIGKMT
jgi:hypothetical protein